MTILKWGMKLDILNHCAGLLLNSEPTTNHNEYEPVFDKLL